MNRFFILISTLALFVSCSSSKSVTTIAKGNDISMYKYVVYGSEDEGDAELAAGTANNSCIHTLCRT